MKERVVIGWIMFAMLGCDEERGAAQPDQGSDAQAQDAASRDRDEGAADLGGGGLGGEDAADLGGGGVGGEDAADLGGGGVGGGGMGGGGMGGEDAADLGGGGVVDQGVPEPPDPCGDRLIAGPFEAVNENHHRLRGELVGRSRLENDCGGAGPEVVVRYVAERAGFYTFFLSEPRGTAYLSLRRTCADRASQVACTLEHGLVEELAAQQEVFVVVDSAWAPQPFELNVVYAPQDSAPVLEGLEASLDEIGGYRLRVRGSDANADLWNVVINELSGFHEGGEREEMLQGAFGRPSAQGVLFLNFVGAGSKALRVRLRDSRGNESEAWEVTPRRVPGLEAFHLCEEVGLADCAADLICAPLADGPLCLEPTAPRIEAGRAWREGPRLSFLLEGQDTTGDLWNAYVEPLDIGGLVIGPRELVGPIEEVRGQVDFVFSGQDIEAPPGTRGLRITVFDTTHLESEPIDLPLEALPVVLEGQPCDPTRISDRCIDLSGCMVEGELATCRPIDPPVVEGIEAFVTASNVEFGLRIVGRDGDEDVEAVHYRAGDGSVFRARLWTPIDHEEGRFEVLAISHELPGEVWVVDHFGQASPPVEPVVQAPALAEAGAPCNDIFVGCTEGHQCDGRATGRLVCTPLNPPVLAEVRVSNNPAAEAWGVELTGADPEGNLDEIRVDLGDGEFVIHPEFLQPQVVVPEGDGFRVVSLGHGSRGWSDRITHATVYLVDTTGLESERITVLIGEPVEVNLGEVCDRPGAVNRCQPGTGCEYDPNFGHRARLEARGAPTCVPAARPVIDEAQAFVSGEVLGLRVVARDADDDLEYYFLDLVDAEGRHLRDWFDLPRTFDEVEPDGERRIGTAVLDRVPEGAAGARLHLIDRLGLTSEVVELELLARPQVERGEPCDARGAFNTCPEGDWCIDVDPFEPEVTVCSALVTECLPGVEPRRLNNFELGDGFQTAGDTTGSKIRALGGCGGGAGAEVWAFEVPNTGLWQIDVVPRDGVFDPVVYVHDYCAFGNFSIPVFACNDDRASDGFRDDLASRLQLPLEARQTVYLFVDGFRTSQGSYLLEVGPVGE